MFNNGFASWMNTAISDEVQLQITRYAYSLFLTPTVFKKLPIFQFMFSLLFYVCTHVLHIGYFYNHHA